MISPDQLDKVCALLVKCEGCGSQVFLGSDGLAKIVNPSLLSAELLQSLRSEKSLISEYLRCNVTESPIDIPYVARNLDIIVCRRDWVGDSKFIHLGEKPYFRLTPDVFVSLQSAVEELSKGVHAVAARAALPTLDWLGQWISRYYKPHEISGAYLRRVGLPKVDFVDLPNPQHGALENWLAGWKHKWNGTKYVRC